MTSLGASITLRALEQDAHATHHILRACEPVAWIPEARAWLVTRYDLAVQVMRDATRFTVDHPGFTTAQVIGPSMLSRDGSEQQRHRAPFERSFRQDAVRERFRASIQEHADTLIDGFAGHATLDLRSAYAGPLAVRTMIDVLGMHSVAADDVLRWYAEIVDGVTGLSSGAALRASHHAAVAALNAALLPEGQAPTDGALLAAAMHDVHADALTPAEVLSNAAVLLFGGIETTEGMIANALYFALTEPGLLQRLRAEPGLIPQLIEETLRLEPAAAVVDRYAAVSVSLAGAEIQPGDLVRVSLASANRDPAVFADPDRLNLTRGNLRSHVTFAQGPHVCLGLHLARLEAHLALAQLITRLPTLRPRPERISAPSGLIFRKAQHLGVWC
jgi:cytochrome P450